MDNIPDCIIDDRPSKDSVRLHDWRTENPANKLGDYYVIEKKTIGDIHTWSLQRAMRLALSAIGHMLSGTRLVPTMSQIVTRTSNLYGLLPLTPPFFRLTA